MTALCTAGVAPIVPDSPMPFAPSGVQGRGRLHLDRLERRELRGRREAVARERCGLRIARLVEEHRLVERLRDAGRDAAVDLALGDERVDDGAGVVDRDVPQGDGRAGLRVDLHDRDVRAERERGYSALKSPSDASSPRRPASAARPASSTQDSDDCGAPATRSRPASRSSSMSSGLASRRSAASRFAFSATSSAAWRPPLPPIWVDFEPYVPVPRGTVSVSPFSTVTSSTARPRRSATIIANVVSWPCPWENEPVRRIALPSAVIVTAPNSASSARS